MGADVTAELTVEPGLSLCDCDVGQVSQVMNNLLINARQASNEGGTITVHATNQFRTHPFVCIKITNGGHRIPAEIIGRIFDPFFTTKTEGSGLGLAIAFSIVHQHGGWIDVVSDSEKETEFSIFLPASTGKAAAEKQAGPSDGFSTSGIAIVMDDDEDILGGRGRDDDGTRVRGPPGDDRE